MAKQAKGPKVEHFRISLVDDMTHKQLWVMRFTRVSFFVFLISAVMVIMVVSFSLIAYTPIRTFIPGYPDAHTKRAAINNAIKVDSLQNVIYTWMFYADNLKKVMEGEDPVAIDSIIRNTASEISAEKAKKNLDERDSLLRANVKQAEQFGLSQSLKRDLPIEGIHFFTPLKGVVSQGYDQILHPYIDITAPANSVVMSVLDGTVIGAGWSDDSGYTIQIQHSDDLVSVYKHNQKLLKKQGIKFLQARLWLLSGIRERLRPVTICTSSCGIKEKLWTLQNTLISNDWKKKDSHPRLYRIYRKAGFGCREAA